MRSREAVSCASQGSNARTLADSDPSMMLSAKTGVGKCTQVLRMRHASARAMAVSSFCRFTALPLSLPGPLGEAAQGAAFYTRYSVVGSVPSESR